MTQMEYPARSSCQMMSPEPYHHQFVENPTRDETRSPIRKKPHIRTDEPDIPLTRENVPGPPPMSCKYEEPEQPSSSTGRRALTMADREDQ